MGQEIELKFLLPQEWQEASFYENEVLTEKQLQPWQKDHLQASYYDSSDWILKQHHLTYRIRRESGQWVATVKGGGSSHGGLHQRKEWNEIISEPVVKLEWFNGCEAGHLLREALQSKLLEFQFKTDFTRSYALFQWGQSQIEVAVDQGEIVVQHKKSPIRELELELKTGTTSDLLAFGACLSRIYPLRLEKRSKYHRALILAGVATDYQDKPLQDIVLNCLFQLLEAKSPQNFQANFELLSQNFLEQTAQSSVSLAGTNILKQLQEIYLDLSVAREALAFQTTPLLLELWSLYEKAREQ